MKKLNLQTVMSIVSLVLILAGCNMPMAKGDSASVPAASQAQTSSTELTATPIPTLIPTLPPTVIPAKPTDTSVPEIVHKDLPGAPIGKLMQTVYDQVDENTASQKQAFGGDDFRNGKYERPFDKDMNYLPLADLVSIQLSREDPLWIYILFKVDKPFSIDPTANTHFAIEIDTDLDNRGDILVVTGMPKSMVWSTESVLVLTAPDKNVGGATVVKPDENLSEGRGYYTEIFNNGNGDDPDLAWSRLSKVDPSVAQIAFKNTLAGGEKGKFIWLPWSDAGVLDWSLFEFNDHFTLAQAGYPLKEDAENYPLKALWGVDNTCREPSGFTPTGTMPGLCQNYDTSVSNPDPEKSCPPCRKPPCSC
jgi:hypothetical protein